MNVQFQHMLIRHCDTRRSAVLLAKILGLSDPSQLGSMIVVTASTEASVSSEHDAFLVSEEEFEQVLVQIRGRGFERWGDPGKQHRNAIRRRNGGRAMCFEDPDGYLIEVMTQP